MDVLVAGGAGYLGHALTKRLIEHGHKPIIIDSLRYGNPRIVEGVKHYTGDIGNLDLVRRIFKENEHIEACVHCAEIASATISVVTPYEYYYGNVVKSMEFFKALNEYGCQKIIFCSSAAIYDVVAGLAVTESSPVKPRNPFGRAKYMTEQILLDFCIAYGMKGIVLRNFNPIGVELVGENYNDLKSNTILNRLIQVSEGELPYFEISGDNWESRDGTCIRDYVHIWDMALAPVLAINRFDEVVAEGDTLPGQYITLNIGSGSGTTVKEFITAYQNLTGERIKTKVGPKRPGDSLGAYANISATSRILGWKPELLIEEAILGALALQEKYKNEQE